MLWLALLVGCDAPDEPKPPTPTRATSAPHPQRATAKHADLLAELDQELAARTRLAEEHTTDWTRLEAVASLHQQRARLVGGLDDYAAADEALTRAFALAPLGSGPWMTRARLDFALHRLDRVEPSLVAFEKRILIDGPARGELASLRGDVALQRGDHDAARARYTEAETHRATPATCYGFVQLDWREARFDAAQAGLDRCEEAHGGRDPKARAWFDLQRGLVELDRGRWAEAESHYLAGTMDVSGWFLLDEHLAEVRHLQGRTAEAEAAYRDIVRRTNGPEFMDALAGLLTDTGRAAEGAEWANRANRLWRAQLARFPEAAYGHALDHFLDFGADPLETLALARQNVAVRPNGEARVLLARALAATGDLTAAQVEIDAVLATRYRASGLFSAAAAIAAARGDAAAAEALRTQARAINPNEP